MAVTNYHTVNGRILGETTGGVRTDYLTDALGSVTATVNPSAQVINRYTYKPYGGLLAKTGVGADPVNQWVGSLGYGQTGKKYSDVYVRARHYDTANGRWTSKDPIGFNGGDWNVYRYVMNRATDFADPSGWACGGGGGPNCCTEPDELKWWYKRLSHCGRFSGQWQDCPKKDDLKRRCHISIYAPKDCSALLKVITAIADSCNKMCSDPNGGSYDLFDDWTAAVHCCDQKDGTWKYCEGPKCCSTDPDIINWAHDKISACALACLMEHEERHVAECTKGLPPHECCGYSVQLACLVDILQKECKNPEIPPSVKGCMDKAKPFKCEGRYK
jgi:RHS repeat-associated protein